MDPSIIIVFGFLLAATVLFVTEWVPFDVTAILVMVGLVAVGVLDVEAAFSGLSSQATVTIAAMLVLSAALDQTNALHLGIAGIERLAQRSQLVALISTFVVIGAASAFINNTAIVAVFVPMMMRLAPRLGTTPSRLLMPLSFVSMMGGVCTLVGTSTNLIANTLAIEHGQPPLGMFEQLPVGAVIFAVGMVYVVVMAPRLIPERRKTNNPIDSLRRRGILGALWRASPREEGDLQHVVPQAVMDSRVAHTGEHPAIGTAHDPALRPTLAAATGDLALQLPLDDPSSDQAAIVEDDVLIEAVLAPSSDVTGRRLKDLEADDLAGASVLALRKGGRLRRDDLGEQRLRRGDSLLLRINPERVPLLEQDTSFLVVDEVDPERARIEKAPVAVAIMAGVLVVSVLGWLPISVAAVIGAALTIVTGCMTNEEAYRSINWKVIMLLACIIPLGTAMEQTGAAALLAELLMAGPGQWGAHALLAGLFLLTVTLTNLMSNVATIVFLAPISLQAAAALGVDGRPMLMAVTFGASLSFMTPIGYQTNTLVSGPGQYTFKDFMKFGTPLTLICGVICALMIPLVWPF